MELRRQKFPGAGHLTPLLGVFAGQISLLVWPAAVTQTTEITGEFAHAAR